MNPRKLMRKGLEVLQAMHGALLVGCVFLRPDGMLYTYWPDDVSDDLIRAYYRAIQEGKFPKQYGGSGCVLPPKPN